MDCTASFSDAEERLTGLKDFVIPGCDLQYIEMPAGHWPWKQMVASLNSKRADATAVSQDIASSYGVVLFRAAVVSTRFGVVS